VSGGPQALVGRAPRSLEALLQRFEALTPPASRAGAAVTIVLREGDQEVEVLLIERTVDSEDPASGQVALPGGHVGEGDASLVATALRELEEEVGLTRTDLGGPPRYVGTLFAARFGIHVAVFAAPLAAAAGLPSARSAGEVAHVFWLPRSALGRTQRVHRDTPEGYREFNASIVDGHVLWGFTRRILRQFFELPTEDDLLGPSFAHAPARS
jgi:8-oxo-dGTP pyrophosphatase MutT (NUDIX family)